MERKVSQYIPDLLYGSLKYPSGLLRPRVVRGYFEQNEYGELQRNYFEHLLAAGFQRTKWQLIFPGQTAGLVRQMEPLNSGVNECHVRFYEDGVIDPELEVHRWGSTHWSGPRESGIEYVLTRIDTPDSLMSAITGLLEHKGYSAECVRMIK